MILSHIPIFDFNESGFYSNYSPKITYDRRSFNGNLGNAGYLTMAWGMVDINCGEQAPVSTYGQVIDGSKVAGTLHEHNNLNIVTAPSVNSGTVQNEWGLSLAGEQGINLLWVWLEDDNLGSRNVKYKLNKSGTALKVNKGEEGTKCSPELVFNAESSIMKIAGICLDESVQQYEILSSTGQQVTSGFYSGNSEDVTIEIGILPPSVYLFRIINSNSQQYVKKFIVR
ncbi:MAG: hypothetical protein U0Y08_15130 [Bacteroidia bacterium]